jgi:hypothetical protein
LKQLDEFLKSDDAAAKFRAELSVISTEASARAAMLTDRIFDLRNTWREGCGKAVDKALREALA